MLGHQVSVSLFFIRDSDAVLTRVDSVIAAAIMYSLCLFSCRPTGFARISWRGRNARAER